MTNEAERLGLTACKHELLAAKMRTEFPQLAAHHERIAREYREAQYAELESAVTTPQ